MAFLTHAFLLDTYFVGNFVTFLEQVGFSLFTITNSGNLPFSVAFLANRTIILLLELFPPLEGSSFNPFKTRYLISCKPEELLGPISIIYVLRFVTLK
jgi:hypothetical protein